MIITLGFYKMIMHYFAAHICYTESVSYGRRECIYRHTHHRYTQDVCAHVPCPLPSTHRTIREDKSEQVMLLLPVLLETD